jgi:hypothetical protein
MIPDRLPWRHRARPSATLHEIQVRSPIDWKSKLVPVIVQKADSSVKGNLPRFENREAWGSRVVVVRARNVWATPRREGAPGIGLLKK